MVVRTKVPVFHCIVSRLTINDKVKVITCVRSGV